MESTCEYAGSALDAFLDINRGRFFLFPSDRTRGAGLKAFPALLTVFFINLKFNKINTDPRRALLFSDMRLVFLSEIPQSGEYRIRCGLTQAT